MVVAAPKNDLDELLKLPEEERLEIARALLSSLLGDEDAEDNDLDEEERQRLHEALDRSEEGIKAGRTRPGHMILDELRARATR
jgi:hypothetical protein